MRLENILGLTYGTLVNEPFVNNFENIIFEVKKIKRGDLFIAFNESDINDAILNGAYGVIFDKPTQISDNEIAWIKVKDTKEALKKLLRFKLIEKNLSVYECDDITIKLAKQIVVDSKLVIVDGDILSIYKLLYNIESNSIILISSTLADKDLFTDINPFVNSTKQKIQILEHTLFETSFIYDNIFYERQQITPLFLPYLEKLLNLYKSLGLNFRIKKLTQIEHFEAVFINKNFKQKEFGSSDKVLIYEKNISFLDDEIEFLNKEATWGKIIYIVPFFYKRKGEKDFFSYKNDKELLDILKTNNFNFALIVAKDKNILSLADTKQQQLTLAF